MKLIFAYIVILFTFLNIYGCAKKNLEIDLSGQKCREGYYKGPNDDFSIFVFCEATGNKIGVINVHNVAGTETEQVMWPYPFRFWQDREWSVDVTKVRWSDDGYYLYVTTSGTYGTDKTYKLNLRDRKVYK
ncbi:MAG: hypothetical protein K0R02_1229 [Rickettsiaceae bacterium]|jgi:hypothetical protein|nr:hypothetical protein [Rickettsiaceae bacterium]